MTPATFNLYNTNKYRRGPKFRAGQARGGPGKARWSLQTNKINQFLGDMLGGHRILINFLAKCHGTEAAGLLRSAKRARRPEVGASTTQACAHTQT